ncbi:zinc ABC transporter substrate-binding protein [Niveispirillum sp. BGYR6]|uniref:zinc ABC transporter substrate-binding protein n=1 Tax=Niveispirillum sp. BGYR6 TaxID=2971249 RepID=UPI0022B98736|nr:zinc ABC transporter substrate-binding protein [Niveispirillum sp. BGYR6]MDG5496882.1 zinc ABC transporter substrate-binding protein [Niveispirillum sp. BGYR6]
MLTRRFLRLLPVAALFWAMPALAAPPPDVVVSVKPLHALVAGVMEGVGNPYLLVRGAASPHDFTLRPSDAKALNGAELVVWVGPALETFLEKPLAALGGGAVKLSLASADGVRVLPSRAGGVWEAHDHSHAHDDHHDHDHDHGASGTDGHIWLDPRNAIAITQAVADNLAKLDPERATTYRANAQKQVAAIEALDRELAAQLAPVKDRPFIVFHDAYHYLEDRYALAAAGAITVTPDQRPGAARLSQLRHAIADAKAVCVFAEPQFEPALVKVLVEGSAVRTGTLDPEGANIPEGAGLYPTLMRFNAKALVDCLSGG